MVPLSLQGRAGTTVPLSRRERAGERALCRRRPLCRTGLHGLIGPFSLLLRSRHRSLCSYMHNRSEMRRAGKWIKVQIPGGLPSETSAFSAKSAVYSIVQPSCTIHSTANLPHQKKPHAKPQRRKVLRDNCLPLCVLRETLLPHLYLYARSLYHFLHQKVSRKAAKPQRTKDLMALFSLCDFALLRETLSPPTFPSHPSVNVRAFPFPCWHYGRVICDKHDFLG